MTTRFSLAELADMLHTTVDLVRQAADALANEFSGESFLYNERTWRIAPSDVKRIQTWLEEHADSGCRTDSKRARRVRVKRIESAKETDQ